MKDKVLNKIAAQDAYDYGLALMFFGEGAGNRRKLIRAAVDQKVQDIPGYLEAFDEAFGKLNQLEIAEKALEERKKIDKAAKAAKNVRALKSGNLRNLSTGIYIVVVGAYVAHVTGYDKVIAEEAKRAYKKGKRRFDVERRRYRARRGYTVTKVK